MKDKIIEVIEDLKAKGYFKEDNGVIRRYNKFYNSFEQLNRQQLQQILFRQYLSMNDVSEYLFFIIDELPVFPKKEFNDYEKYIKYSKEPSFKNVLNCFLNGLYLTNQGKKTDLTSINESSRNIYLDNIMQLLINNDIFTDKYPTNNLLKHRLFKFDKDKEAFILVTVDNISNFIDVKNQDILKLIFEKASNNPTHKLTYLWGAVDDFNKAKNRDSIIENSRKSYNYIVNLIESFKLDK